LYISLSTLWGAYHFTGLAGICAFIQTLKRDCCFKHFCLGVLVSDSSDYLYSSYCPVCISFCYQNAITRMLSPYISNTVSRAA